MKHIYFIMLSVFIGKLSFAQGPRQLDTVYANERMNLALFFPANIRQGITGADNFVFSYNRERAQPLGLLKATKGGRSNLLVVTTDGKVYSYIIGYAEDLPEKNRFISFSESIGHEHQREPFAAKDSAKLDTDLAIKERYPREFLERSCAVLLEQRERRNIVKRKDGMSLAIRNMVYYEDLVFVQFEIENGSGIDFDIDYLRLSLIIGNDKRKASYQSVPLVPAYVHKMPGKIRYGETTGFVYVVPKFTLGDNERLEVRLKELKGNRELAFRRRL